MSEIKRVIEVIEQKNGIGERRFIVEETLSVENKIHSKTVVGKYETIEQALKKQTDWIDGIKRTSWSRVRLICTEVLNGTD